MSVFKYLNPLYPFFRAKQDVTKSFHGVSDALRDAKQRLKDEREAAAKAGELGDPKERFEAAVIEGNWSKADLERQISGARRARRYFSIFSYISVPCSVAATLFMPGWIALFLLPGTLVFFILMMSLSAKHAWWEWQISERSFESFKKFASMPDFIKRVIIP